MNCVELQDRLLEPGPRPVAERAAIEDHLETCHACREFAARVDDLDRSLHQQLRAPSLPADFDARLWARIAAESASRAGANLGAPANSPREAPGTGSDPFERSVRWVWVGRLLDGAAGGTLVALLAAVLIRHLPVLDRALAMANLSVGAQAAAASAVALVLVGGGCVVAFPGQINRLLQRAL